MKDYHLHYDDGRVVAVADLPTSEIQECLRVGVEALEGLKAEAIIERLRLEIFIRERNLRL